MIKIKDIKSFADNPIPAPKAHKDDPLCYILGYAVGVDLLNKDRFFIYYLDTSKNILYIEELVTNNILINLQNLQDWKVVVIEDDSLHAELHRYAMQFGIFPPRIQQTYYNNNVT